MSAGLTICTWFWGGKYSVDYVHRLARGLKRHLKQPYRFIVVTDDVMGNGLASVINEPAHGAWPIADPELMKMPGCFARLRMFDPAWQAEYRIEGRLACIDLDCVVTGDLDPVFLRPEPFMILQGANASNPCPYNGSLWMLRAGYRPDVWTDFSLEAAQAAPHYEFPDDQAWLAHKIPGEAGWKAGAQSGVYAFMKPGWTNGYELPKGARLVCFPGRRDPNQFKHLPWVKEHWLG